MTVKEAATCLGYVVLFSAVVAWGFLLHSPRPAPVEAEYGHSARVLTDAPPIPSPQTAADSQIRRVTASMLR
jgi:hypothetical protein